MNSKIFITRTGYDPELGKHVKDPYLGTTPTLGACRTDVRRLIQIGGHIFVVSGRVKDVDQFVMAGFVVDAKIDSSEAYERFPELRLSRLPDGQITGNIIVDQNGKQHPFDNHPDFERRKSNYIVGKDLIALTSPEEIKLGREQTLVALSEILRKEGARPVDLVGHYGSDLTEKQALQLREWLLKIKNTTCGKLN